METATMGRIVVQANMENFQDVLNVRTGMIAPEKIRSISVDDALVDTGAKFLGLPTRLIQQLGLVLMETKVSNTAAGMVPCNIYSPAQLTVQGRRCEVTVGEVPDSCPVLIGFFPLELLDFVVDPKNQRLVSDPWVGEQRTLDMF